MRSGLWGGSPDPRRTSWSGLLRPTFGLHRPTRTSAADQEVRPTKSRETGVTLVELLIAISLVALLSTAMLMALRGGFLSYRKTTDRMQDNRRTSNIEAILARQIAGVIPVIDPCGGARGFFSGTPTTMRLVSSYSLSEGARGLPRIVELQVVPSPEGGLRLLMLEHLYTGPSSTLSFCAGARMPVVANPPFVVADGLASCRFLYREAIPDAVLPGSWVPDWFQPNLPSAVRIEMLPLRVAPGRLAAVPITVPIRITREVVARYADEQ